MAQEQAGRVLRSASWRAGLDRRGAGDVARAAAQADARGVGRGPQRGARWGAPAVQCHQGRTRQVLRFLDARGACPGTCSTWRSRPRRRGCCCCRPATGSRPRSGTARMTRQGAAAGPAPGQARPAGLPGLDVGIMSRHPAAHRPAGAVLHLPRLRIAGGTVRADLAFSHAVPRSAGRAHGRTRGGLGPEHAAERGRGPAARRRDDHRLGAGAQYGPPGSWPGSTGCAATASGCTPRPAGTPAHRRRRRHPLNAKSAVLAEEIGRVSQRRSHLNDALAWSAARWATDQAIAAGATVIYLEDLRSMEAGTGRTSTPGSPRRRGRIADRIRHLAAENGIAVVTSRPAAHPVLSPLAWPRYGTPRHPTSPPRRLEVGHLPQPGVRLARRPGPGRLAAHRRPRPRLPRHDHHRPRRRTMAIRAAGDSMEAPRSSPPSPPGATGQGRSHPQPNPTPRAQATGAPSPARPPAAPAASGGTRTHGPAPAPRSPPEPGRDDDQHTHPAHQPRGAALGAGFHLHAHATPPRWEPVPGPAG